MAANINNMEKILLNVDYTDNTGKFWQDSYIKNKIFTVKKDIFTTIKEAIEEKDFMKLSYNGKPQGNIFVDDKNGNTKKIGYIFRGITNIEGKKALFDVWVNIYEVLDYPIIEIN
jgi:hypothetical protein